MKKHNKTKYKVFIVCLIFVSSLILPISAYSKSLIPCGKTVGISVNTKGVCVIDTAEFENSDGKSVSPATDAGILSGDFIIRINGKDVKSSEDLYKLTNKIKDKNISVDILRNGEEKTYEVSLWGKRRRI